MCSHLYTYIYIYDICHAIGPNARPSWPSAACAATSDSPWFGSPGMTWAHFWALENWAATSAEIIHFSIIKPKNRDLMGIAWESIRKYAFRYRRWHSGANSYKFLWKDVILNLNHFGWYQLAVLDQPHTEKRLKHRHSPAAWQPSALAEK